MEQGATDAGVVLPGRYVADDATRSPGVVRNEAAMIAHARRLADRVDAVLAAGATPLAIGGDCSLLLGAGRSTRRRGGAGLVHVDGHTDFRHPGTSDDCASVAHIGRRDDEAELAEVRAVLGALVPTAEWRGLGTAAVVTAVRTTTGAAGYWLQVDVDLLDATVMPAVDSPDPGGCTPGELIELLRGLAPRAVGASVPVYYPDLDPDGVHAQLLRTAHGRTARSSA